jgi:hypothetical protein
MTLPIDTDHCHWFSAPAYTDAVANRDALVANGFAVAPPTGFLAPPNSLGKPCTNTGLSIPLPTTITVSNFTDGELIECDIVTGAVTARIPLLGTAGAAGQLQANFWDSVTEEYGVLGATTNVVEFYARTGGSPTRTIPGYSNTGCYDPGLDAYWFRFGTGTLRRVSRTGTVLATLPLQGPAAGITVEGVAPWIGTDWLFVTQNASTNVFVVDKYTGVVVAQFRGVNDQEHVAYHQPSGHLFINGDGRFHSPVQGGESIVYRLTTAGDPVGWTRPTTSYSIEWMGRPTTISGTSVPLAWWTAIKNGQFYFEVQFRLGGVVRTYKPDLTFVDSAAGVAVTNELAHWRVTYDAAARTLATYKNNALISLAVNVTWAAGPDGRIGINNRPDGNPTTKHTGLVDDIRVHRSARTPEYWAARQAEIENPTPPPDPPPDPPVCPTCGRPL